jgi:DNA primase
VSVGTSYDIKEQVRQATDLVDLVSRSIRLRHQGRIYVGLCPWHDDSRPSLQVNPDRQSWKCWVCNIGGDVFSFVM